ncbi:MAG: trigger factor [Brevinematales bacterium]|nr:trigger factor [Brevinematales bacterium]
MEIVVRSFPDCYAVGFVSWSVFESAELWQRALAHLQTSVDVPGFRKGKAPFDILEQRYEEAVKKEVEELALREGVNQLRAEHNLIALYDYKLSSEVAKNVPLRMVFYFGRDVVVKRGLADIKLTTVDYEKVELTEKDITEMVKRELVEPKEITSKSEKGDVMHLLFKGKTDPVVVRVDDIPEKLIGKKAGDTVVLDWKEVGNLVFDVLEDIKAKGETEVQVLKVLRVSDVDVQDESLYAKTPFQTKEKYVEFLKNVMQREIEAINHRHKVRALKEAVKKDLDIELSKGVFYDMVESRFKDWFFSHFKASVAMKDVLADKKLPEDMMAMMTSVYDDLKFYYAMIDYAKKNGIEATQEMISKVVMRQASEAGEDYKDYVEKMTKEAWDNALAQAQFDAAVEKFMEKVTFREKKVIGYYEFVRSEA